jgi:CrcB protein
VVTKLAWLAAAGAIGTLARYGLGGLVQRTFGVTFPWGTLAVNGLGCFLFGLVWTLAEDRLLISGETRFIVLTGFMGAFTTFSTFTFETGELMRDSEWLLALGNFAAQNVLGLLLLFAGLAAGRSI